nr:FGGY family carbohydrate kinase [Anaerolineae bacterium]
MSGRYLLGLDIGTSVVKAALFDEAGREVAVASSRARLLPPRPDWVEASLGENWQMAA